MTERQLEIGDIVLCEGTRIGIVVHPNFNGNDPLVWCGAEWDIVMKHQWHLNYPSVRDLIFVGKMEPPADGMWPWDVLDPRAVLEGR